MKSKDLLMSLVVAFAVAGCASTPSQQSDENPPAGRRQQHGQLERGTPSQQSVEKPPAKANRVQVLMYDTTTRPKTAHLDIYELKEPERHYKVIALLTCEGAVDQEVVMTTAIFYRARQIGADGVMGAGTITTMKEGTLNVADTVGKQIMMNAVGLGGSGARCVFRYRAIVYEDK